MSSNSSKVHEADLFIHGPGLSAALENLAADQPDRIYLRTRDRVLTVAELNFCVDATVKELRRHGVGGDSRVALALDVSIDHVALIFALLRIGALWIPTNTQIKGEPLLHHLRDSGATVVIAEASSPFASNLPETIESEQIDTHGAADSALICIKADSVLIDESGRVQEARQDACLLMYTSGTTGPPKGALVTETMLRAAVLGALEVTEPRAGDVFYVWEPLFHIGGAQVVFVPLFSEVTLALTPKFSASRFWRDIVDFDVTHIHYLGGVLQILLQLPPVPDETRNRVRIAWGAGATPEVREACHARYKFALHECYGMTEASSIVTVNRNDPDGGVGIPFPWVEVAIESSGDSYTPRGEKGEIRVRGLVDGLVTPGYLGNVQASAAAKDGEWFKTGDIGYLDENHALHFEGRGSDSIRVRGENISAWQIESVFGMHPHVDRCAVVGVEAEVGEQEMLLLVTEVEGTQISLPEVVEWSRNQLAKFQIPRYAKIIPEMPLTPSQRVSKHKLTNEVLGAFDTLTKTVVGSGV